MRRLLLGLLAASALASVAHAQSASGYSSNTGGSTGPTKITINSPPNDLSNTGTLSAPGTVTVNSQGAGSVGVIITGTGTGLTYTLQGSADGTNYVNVPFYNPVTGVVSAAGATLSANATLLVCEAGLQNVRLNLTAIASNSETVTLNASAGSCPPPISTAGGSLVDVIGVNNGTVSTGGGSADTHTMRVAAAFQTTTSTNGSTTISSGGSFQTLLASNTSRKGCMIQNPTTATEVLYVNVGGADTTATSYSLSPGLAFNCWTGSFVISDKIDVEAATTGHAFIATNQ